MAATAIPGPVEGANPVRTVRQRIIISGLGGQGALTLTRLLAEAAAAQGHEVITAETHGMAQRGGSVISMVKVGPFKGPLIGAGEADAGLFLHAGNLPVHGHLLRPGARLFVNAAETGDGERVDAGRIAAGLGSAVAANLVLLGFAAGRGGIFCDAAVLEKVIAATVPPRFLEMNLRALRAGVEAAGGGGK